MPTLFSADRMRRLGYLDRWAADVAAMRHWFEHCRMDFDAFFRRIKRLGCFMHTVNHPRVEVLVALAAAVARALGTPNDAPVPMPDALAADWLWPVYPAVGEALGLPHGLLWRIGDRHFDLPGFVARAYREHAAQGVPAAAMETVPDQSFIPEETLDAVLGA